jgi:hypothetical protein
MFATLWMFGDEIQRVTGRDVYHEVEEFICNDVVLTTKIHHWVIEGPRDLIKTCYQSK